MGVPARPDPQGVAPGRRRRGPAGPHAASARDLDALPPAEGQGEADYRYAVAHRYRLAGDRAEPGRARAACRTASELALAGYTPAEAVTFLGHAVALSEQPDGRLLHDLGTALQCTGTFSAAGGQLTQALAVETDPLTLLLFLAAQRPGWARPRPGRGR